MYQWWQRYWNQYSMKLWREKFVSYVTFSKYFSFDSCGDVINPKLCQKGAKLVFHVPMVMEKWKSIVKRDFRWGIRFWNHYFKILKFFLRWCHQPKNGSKRSNLAFHVPMMTEIKSKNYFEVIVYETILSKFWSFDLLWWCHQPKISSKKDTNLYVMK